MNPTKIKAVHARHLIDCKARGLVEVDITTESGAIGRASAPTGTSTGLYESFVLRDDPPGRFLGTSVFKSVDIVNQVIAPAIIGKDAVNQQEIDNLLLELDGTPRKTRLGGNTIYSVSGAVASAAAAALGKPLHHYWAQEPITTIPLPVCNMFNGGKYHNCTVEFQEFGVVPYKAADVMEAVEICITIFAEVGRMITERQHGEAPGIANYFGHMPVSNDPAVLFGIIQEAAERRGYKDKICFALDCAAGELYNESQNTYTLMGKEIDTDEMIGYLQALTNRFPFLYVEDILAEHDFEGFAKAAKSLAHTRVIGDDFTSTSSERVEKAVAMGACEGLVFKPNQIGTISQSLETYRFAKEKNLLVIPSVRAGGTIDDPVKDMAIALGTPLVKTGAPRSGERISFLNTLLRAHDEFPEAKLYDFKLK